jgi:hypothetical protein
MPENRDTNISDKIAQSTIRTEYLEKTIKYVNPLVSMKVQQARRQLNNTSSKPSYIYLK